MVRAKNENLSSVDKSDVIRVLNSTAIMNMKWLCHARTYTEDCIVDISLYSQKDPSLTWRRTQGKHASPVSSVLAGKASHHQ